MLSSAKPGLLVAVFGAVISLVSAGPIITKYPSDQNDAWRQATERTFAVNSMFKEKIGKIIGGYESIARYTWTPGPMLNDPSQADWFRPASLDDLETGEEYRLAYGVYTSRNLNYDVLPDLKLVLSTQDTPRAGNDPGKSGVKVIQRFYKEVEEHSYYYMVDFSVLGSEDVADVILSFYRSIQSARDRKEMVPDLTVCMMLYQKVGDEHYMGEGDNDDNSEDPTSTGDPFTPPASSIGQSSNRDIASLRTDDTPPNSYTPPSSFDPMSPGVGTPPRRSGNPFAPGAPGSSPPGPSRNPLWDS
ncbi:MAG: hypothetical protein M1825_001971 [Sarcosagium campestre]|nr:MAG: hypothetical protein M1825_001971 [Sarcosagium campestre]